MKKNLIYKMKFIVYKEADVIVVGFSILENIHNLIHSEYSTAYLRKEIVWG